MNRAPAMRVSFTMSEVFLRSIRMLILATVLVGCGTHQLSPSPQECNYIVSGPAEIPDAAAYEGGMTYGDLPQSECAELCDGSVAWCKVESRSPTKINCSPGCF
jgi:hypothetical protein